MNLGSNRLCYNCWSPIDMIGNFANRCLRRRVTWSLVLQMSSDSGIFVKYPSLHSSARIRLHTYNSPALSKHWICLYNMRKIHGDGFWWSLSLFIFFMQDFWAEIRKTWTFSFLKTDINSNNISEMVWSILSNNVNLHWEQIYLLD